MKSSSPTVSKRATAPLIVHISLYIGINYRNYAVHSGDRNQSRPYLNQHQPGFYQPKKRDYCSRHACSFFFFHWIQHFLEPGKFNTTPENHRMSNAYYRRVCVLKEVRLFSRCFSSSFFLVCILCSSFSFRFSLLSSIINYLYMNFSIVNSTFTSKKESWKTEERGNHEACFMSFPEDTCMTSWGRTASKAPWET